MDFKTALSAVHLAKEAWIQAATSKDVAAIDAAEASYQQSLVDLSEAAKSADEHSQALRLVRSDMTCWPVVQTRAGSYLQSRRYATY